MARSHGGPWSDFFKSGSRSLGSGGFEAPPAAESKPPTRTFPPKPKTAAEMECETGGRFSISTSRPPISAEEYERLSVMIGKKVADMERAHGGGETETFSMGGRRAGKSVWTTEMMALAMGRSLESAAEELAGPKEPVDEHAAAAQIILQSGLREIKAAAEFRIEDGLSALRYLLSIAKHSLLVGQECDDRSIEELVQTWTCTHTAALRFALCQRRGFWWGWSHAKGSGTTWGPGGMAMGGMLKPDHAPMRPDHLIAVDEAATFSKKTLAKMFTGRSDLGISHATIRPPIQMADGRNLYWDANRNAYVDPMTGAMVSLEQVRNLSEGKGGEAAKPPAAPEADLDELVARAAGDFGVF